MKYLTENNQVKRIVDIDKMDINADLNTRMVLVKFNHHAQKTSNNHIDNFDTFEIFVFSEFFLYFRNHHLLNILP